MTKVSIYGNKIEGDCRVIPSKRESDLELVFNNNIVEGDAIIDMSKLDDDIEVTQCTFRWIHSGIPPELWFVYANFLNDRDHHDIARMVKEKLMTNLVFNSEGENDPACIARRCWEVLARNVPGGV